MRVTVTEAPTEAISKIRSGRVWDQGNWVTLVKLLHASVSSIHGESILECVSNESLRNPCEISEILPLLSKRDVQPRKWSGNSIPALR